MYHCAFCFSTLGRWQDFVMNAGDNDRSIHETSYEDEVSTTK